MMNLQSAQIRSQTIALMKQNDFAMTMSDLKASALTISDLITYQDRVVNTATLQNLNVTNQKFFSSPFESRPNQTDAQLRGYQNLMKQKLWAAELEGECLQSNTTACQTFRSDYLAYYLLPKSYNQTEFFWMNNQASIANLQDLEICALA